MRNRWLEWALLALLVLAGVAALSAFGAMPRINLVIEDQVARLNPRTPSPEVLIVAVDDASLAAVGRWPWRRGFHAALLDRISADGPKAIGLDLIFTETDPVSAADDVLLADAMKRAGRVVLPLVLQDVNGSGRLTRTEPVAPIARAAAALAHIHLETDADAAVRSVFLREGQAGAGWDYLGLAVLRAGGFALPDPLPGRRAPGVENDTDRRDESINGAGTPAATRPALPLVQTPVWRRDFWMQIPYAGPTGSFTRVSYIDVLQGRVPPGFFKDKYVLVGATSGGLADAYPTPQSANGQLMPGVEIAANVMTALLKGDALVRANAWQSAAFNILPVGLALLAALLLTPTLSLVASAALFAATLVCTWAAARYAGLQLAPAAALLGLLLVYPLWIWRRLRTALDYLIDEFRRMEARRDLPAMLPTARTGDVLDHHIDALRGATQQLRNLHRFVSDTLGSLPDATLISGPAGQVLMSNQTAQNYFARGADELRGRTLVELLAGVNRAGSSLAAFDAQRLDELRTKAPAEWGCEARDAQGRDLLVRCVPCFNTEGASTGWIVSLVDITHIRETERQRDLALRFISHDMRSPQASILALLELQRMRPDVPMAVETLARIDRHARRTLDLAEEFVQLARAESSEYQLELQDLSELLGEAVDEVWAQAQARHVQVEIERAHESPEPGDTDELALCDADRSLVTRAITNLLGNAIKYGPEHGHVRCSVQRVAEGWRVAIADQGPGMTEAEQALLFQQFSRLKSSSHAPGPSASGRSDPGGVGLGLVFVRTVVERHGGTVGIDSQPGRGTTFFFTLPAARIDD